MTDRYISTAGIAALFNVDTKTVAQWRSRYPDFPAPDVMIGKTAGWHPSRVDEIRRWHDSRPGQGARSDLKETK
jgi:hypothetical protein